LESRLQTVRRPIEPKLRLTKFNQIAADLTKFRLWAFKAEIQTGNRAVDSLSALRHITILLCSALIGKS